MPKAANTFTYIPKNEVKKKERFYLLAFKKSTVRFSAAYDGINGFLFFYKCTVKTITVLVIHRSQVRLMAVPHQVTIMVKTYFRRAV